MSDNTEINTEQVRCSNCGRTKDIVHTAKSGTQIGEYFGLIDPFSADVCQRCWSRLPETVSKDDGFGLMDFEGWKRQITSDDSRFVSATWQSDNHTIALDAVGDGEWTVSWFGENEASEETDEWYSRYEARQFAIDQIQQMIRLIKSGTVSASGVVADECQESGDVEENSTSDCDRCGSIAETQWIVQAETPAGRYLGLSDSETTELCDACMREVTESIADEDENARNESTQGGENE